MTFTVSRRGTGSQSTVCTVTLRSLQATCSIAFPAAGVYDVAAFYVPGSGVGGAGSYVPSQGSVTVTVVSGTVASGSSGSSGTSGTAGTGSGTGSSGAVPSATGTPSTG